MRCGKKACFPPFNSSFTLLPQRGGNPNARISAGHFPVFHIFPTPYYDYYNKFNILQPFCSVPTTALCSGTMQKGEILF